MPIPDFQKIMLPLLELLSDRKVCAFKDVVDSLSSEFKLTTAELNELLPGGTQPIFRNRVVILPETDLVMVDSIVIMNPLQPIENSEEQSSPWGVKLAFTNLEKGMFQPLRQKIANWNHLQIFPAFLLKTASINGIEFTGVLPISEKSRSIPAISLNVTDSQSGQLTTYQSELLLIMLLY